jgi:DNA-binding MarR family transcriptional regulator
VERAALLKLSDQVMTALYDLELHDGYSPVRLIDALGVDETQLGRALRYVEKHGWITADHVFGAQLPARVTLSPAGMRYAESLMNASSPKAPTSSDLYNLGGPDSAPSKILLGVSQLTSIYDKSVFLNCPFDEQYAPLFQAALFSIVACGFEPRTARDIVDASQVRIHKIYDIIAACRLGIHDLSRVEPDAESGLPRFNMPLEFGIFLGAKFLGDPNQKTKMCLVFDQQPYRYQKYLSDVAGQDISSHRNDPKVLLTEVRNWLADVVKAHIPSGSFIWDRFQTFRGELRHACETARQRPEELTYGDFLRHVREFLAGYKEKLSTRGETERGNPSLGDIADAIRGLRVGPDPFVILGKGASGLSYMQAALNEDKSWRLEYQQGHIDEHYKCQGDVTREQVLKAFIAYASGLDTWRTDYTWSRQTL